VAVVNGADIVRLAQWIFPIDLGIGGGFDRLEYQHSLGNTDLVCHMLGKIFGVAGFYDFGPSINWARGSCLLGKILPDTRKPQSSQSSADCESQTWKAGPMIL
jgi:hypothetical protein